MIAEEPRERELSRGLRAGREAPRDGRQVEGGEASGQAARPWPAALSTCSPQPSATRSPSCPRLCIWCRARRTGS